MPFCCTAKLWLGGAVLPSGKFLKTKLQKLNFGGASALAALTSK